MPRRRDQKKQKRWGEAAPDSEGIDFIETKLKDDRAASYHYRLGGVVVITAYMGLLWQVVAAHALHAGILVTALALTALAILLLRANGQVRELSTQRHRARLALSDCNARLRLAHIANDIAIVDWDIADDHAVWSLNFVDVFGISDGTPPTKTPYALFIELVHPDDRSRIDAMHSRILKTGGTFSEEFRTRTSAGTTRWIAIHGEVFCDERGTPRRFIGSNFDITERRINEDRVKQSLAMIEIANDAGEIGVWNIDVWGDGGTWDERSRSILGIAGANERINFTKFKHAIHPDDRSRARSVFAQAMQRGEKFLLETRIMRPDHTIRWIRLRGLVEIDPVSNRAVKMTGIVFDITDRRQHEAHLRFLMRELTHRSKNLLAVIQAMARQTSDSSTSLDDFQTRFSARLQGLAASHDLLVNEDWLGAYLTDIVRSQVGHLTELIDEQVRISGQNLLIKPEAAQNIGLALHELSTNAAKYGALANTTGIVDISWTVEGASLADSRLVLVWRESGGLQVSPPQRRGFGMIVTERIVARALEGKVTMLFDPDGVKWTLDIPASYILSGVRGQQSTPVDPANP